VEKDEGMESEYLASSAGIRLKRGYKLESLLIRMTAWDGTLEPPRDLKRAVEKRKNIWETMHSKWAQKRKSHPTAKSYGGK
jgi:hypothetical protein